MLATKEEFKETNISHGPFLTSSAGSSESKHDD